MIRPIDADNAPVATLPAIAVIVLNWNGRAMTLDCLESLDQVRTARVLRIVVDNASTDGSVEEIRSRYGNRVSVLVNEENLGFSRGNNIGIRYALERGAQFVLLLNNDTVVAPDFLDHLVAPMAAEATVGITGPKIYYYTPRDRIWFAGGEIFLARGTARHIGIRERDHGQFDRRREVDYVTGCALMARREVFDTIGALDASYRAYFEDADFCMRARRAGFRVEYVPEAKVWHRISASTGGQIGRRKMQMKCLSSFRFFGRYAKPWHWLTIPLFFALDVIRIVCEVCTGRIRDSG